DLVIYSGDRGSLKSPVVAGTARSSTSSTSTANRLKRSRRSSGSPTLRKTLLRARADGESRGAYCSCTNSGVPRQNAESGYRSRQEPTSGRYHNQPSDYQDGKLLCAGASEGNRHSKQHARKDVRRCPGKCRQNIGRIKLAR